MKSEDENATRPKDTNKQLDQQFKSAFEKI